MLQHLSLQVEKASLARDDPRLVFRRVRGCEREQSAFISAESDWGRGQLQLEHLAERLAIQSQFRHASVAAFQALDSKARGAQRLLLLHYYGLGCRIFHNCGRLYSLPFMSLLLFFCHLFVGRCSQEHAALATLFALAADELGASFL